MTTLCSNWLIPKFDSLVEIFTDTDIQLITMGRKVDFDIDNIDLSIEYGLESDFSCSNKYKIATGKLVLVGSYKYKNKSCSEIISQQKLIYVNDVIRINNYNDWCKHNNIKTLHNKEIVFKNSIQAIKACLSGVGFLITEKLLVDEYIKDGMLYTPEQKILPTGKDYYLLSDKENFETFEKVKKLLSSLLKK